MYFLIVFLINSSALLLFERDVILNISLYIYPAIFFYSLIVAFPLVDVIAGRRDIFDPVSMLSLFSLHFLIFSPLYQVSENYYPYLNWSAVNTSYVGTWFLITSLAIFCLLTPAYVLSRGILPSKETIALECREVGSLIKILNIFIAISAFVKIYTLFHLGGFSGIAAAYTDRLEFGVSSYNPLKGIGALVYVGDALPVLLMIKIMLDWPRARLAIILTLSVILSVSLVGWYGSRSNIIYSIFFVLIYIHFINKKLGMKWMLSAFVGLIVVMNAMIIYKFGGLEAVFDANVRKEVFHKRGIENPLAFVAVRDFGRMDVQTIAVTEVLAYDYPLALGRSYFGGLTSIVPSAIFPSRPENFTKEKTEIIFPGATASDDFETTLVFGGVGEAFVNFGFYSFFVFLGVGLCIAKLSIFYQRAKKLRQVVILPVISLLPVAFLIYDSNSLMYFFAQFALFPLMLLMIMKFKESK